jgi:hypothetical protein
MFVSDENIRVMNASPINRLSLIPKAKLETSGFSGNATGFRGLNREFCLAS